jgi:hypothetical protein
MRAIGVAASKAMTGAWHKGRNRSNADEATKRAGAGGRKSCRSGGGIGVKCQSWL